MTGDSPWNFQEMWEESLSVGVAEKGNRIFVI